MFETLYFHHPGCSKSRAALALLQERGIAPQLIDYLDTPPTLDELTAIATMLGGDPRAMIRMDEPEALSLALADPAHSEADLLAALRTYPVLLQRPIFVHGGRAVIGRPPERVLDLL